ncbi:hypothetical protein V8C86DRAFT_421604 [Haematococcus lacustris]
MSFEPPCRRVVEEMKELVTEELLAQCYLTTARQIDSLLRKPSSANFASGTDSWHRDQNRSQHGIGVHHYKRLPLQQQQQPRAESLAPGHPTTATSGILQDEAHHATQPNLSTLRRPYLPPHQSQTSAAQAHVQPSPSFAQHHWRLRSSTLPHVPLPHQPSGQQIPTHIGQHARLSQTLERGTAPLPPAGPKAASGSAPSVAQHLPNGEGESLSPLTPNAMLLGGTQLSTSHPAPHAAPQSLASTATWGDAVLTDQDTANCGPQRLPETFLGHSSSDEEQEDAAALAVLVQQLSTPPRHCTRRNAPAAWLQGIQSQLGVCREVVDAGEEQQQQQQQQQEWSLHRQGEDHQKKTPPCVLHSVQAGTLIFPAQPPGHWGNAELSYHPVSYPLAGALLTSCPCLRLWPPRLPRRTLWSQLLPLSCWRRCCSVTFSPRPSP